MDEIKLGIFIVFYLICPFQTDDVAVLLNKPAILRCQIEGVATSNITWRFLGIGKDDDEVIFENSIVQKAFDSFIQPIRSENGHLDLFMIRASKHSAGTYFCHDREETFELKVIVLESHPKCKTENNTDNTSPLFLEESNDVVLSCTVSYWGSVPPSIRWSVLNGEELFPEQSTSPSDRTTNVLQSSVRISSESEFLAQSPTVILSTTVFFASNQPVGFDGDVKELSNYSEYKFVWFSPKILKGFSEYISTTLTDNAIDISKPETVGQTAYYRTEHIILIVIAIVVVALLAAISTVVIAKKLKANGDETRPKVNPTEHIYSKTVNPRNESRGQIRSWQPDASIYVDIDARREENAIDSRDMASSSCIIPLNVRVHEESPGASKTKLNIYKDENTVTTCAEDRSEGETGLQEDNSRNIYEDIKYGDYTELDHANKSNNQPPSIYTRIEFRV